MVAQPLELVHHTVTSYLRTGGQCCLHGRGPQPRSFDFSSRLPAFGDKRRDRYQNNQENTLLRCSSRRDAAQSIAQPGHRLAGTSRFREDVEGSEAV